MKVGITSLPDDLRDGDGERLPERIGRFQIRRRLGSGAFGTVYLADDPVLERQVALKVMRLDAAGGTAGRTRFLREAKAAARLNHPQIVPVFDAGRDAQRYFIAAEYVQGETLETEIERGIPEPRRAARICQRLAAALDYAHQSGIVHRDVKSSNVMVDSTGDVHLMDFGLAQVRGSDERLTSEGAVLGTAAYMAPEQASRELGDVGPRSDQYSLGVVLYELLCGQVPFSGPPQVVLYHVTSTDPARPRSIVSAVPRDLETICLKAMSKRPAGRYADCSELAEDLRRWLVGEAITARRVSPVERLTRWSQRNPLAASLLGVVALLLLLTAIVPTVGYGVVAQRITQRELEEGRREDLEQEVAQAGTDLIESRVEIGKLSDEKARLERAAPELERTSADLLVKWERIRGRQPLEVLEDELRSVVESADVPPEPALPIKPPSGPAAGEPDAAPLVSQPQWAPSPTITKPLTSAWTDPIAAHVPEECFYVRFAGLRSLQRLLQAGEELSAVPKETEGQNHFRTELACLQTQLCLPKVTSGAALADRLIGGLAIIGTAPTRGNFDVGIVVRSHVAGGRLLGETIRGERKRALIAASGRLHEQTVTIDEHDVSLIASDDDAGRVRSFYAVVRGVHLIANSERIVRGFLRAGRGERPIASTAGFSTAERMMRQAPSPDAVFFVPCEFWAEGTVPRNFGPLVGSLSLIGSDLNGHHSLSVEAELPAFSIESLFANQPGAGNALETAVYRQLAQHSLATRLAPVPGDLLSLEVAITDTCRIFGGLNAGSYYLGIAETAAFFDFVQKLLGPWASIAVSYQEILCKRAGLDPEGYGAFQPPDQYQSFPLAPGWRRVFKGDWVAWSPEKPTLEKVTPQLKGEPAPRPATIRLRIDDAQAVARHFGQRAHPVPDCIRALELSLAAEPERLVAYGKIDWIGPPQQQLKVNWTGSSQQQPKAIVQPPPDWERLETLLGMRDLPSLKDRVEKALLRTIARLRPQVFDSVGTDASEAQALTRLFALETVLLSLPARDSLLRTVREDKEMLLNQLVKRLESLSGRAKWLALLEAVNCVPAADRAVRQPLTDKLTRRIEQLDASVQNLRELADLDGLWNKADPDLQIVRKRGDTKRIDLIERLAGDVIQDSVGEDAEKALRLGELLRLLPKTDEGNQTNRRINEAWRNR